MIRMVEANLSMLDLVCGNQSKGKLLVLLVFHLEWHTYDVDSTEENLFLTTVNNVIIKIPEVSFLPEFKREELKLQNLN